MMRRGARFAIGLAAAALTFGSLWAVVGPKHRGHGPWNHHYEERWKHHNGCHGYSDDESQNKTPQKGLQDASSL